MYKNILLVMILVCSASKVHADISHEGCREYLSERITLEINKYPVIDLAGPECIPLAFRYPAHIGVYAFHRSKLMGAYENEYDFESSMSPMLQNDKKTYLDEFCLSEKALKETKIQISYVHFLPNYNPDIPDRSPSCLDDRSDRKIGRKIVIDKLDELLAISE